MENRADYAGSDSLVDKATDIANAVGAKAAALKEKTNEFGRHTIDKIDERRVAAVSALRDTASTMHDSADKIPDIPEMTHSAARRVESTADYLDSHDTRQFIRDIGAVVKNSPVPSLMIAALAGFIIGRTLRR
jgi:ElaB/YqjD/DUF883 family membrane-anchored ribosome-binding protein